MTTVAKNEGNGNGFKMTMAEWKGHVNTVLDTVIDGNAELRASIMGIKEQLINLDKCFVGFKAKTIGIAVGVSAVLSVALTLILYFVSTAKH